MQVSSPRQSSQVVTQPLFPHEHSLPAQSTLCVHSNWFRAQPLLHGWYCCHTIQEHIESHPISLRERGKNVCRSPWILHDFTKKCKENWCGKWCWYMAVHAVAKGQFTQYMPMPAALAVEWQLDKMWNQEKFELAQLVRHREKELPPVALLSFNDHSKCVHGSFFPGNQYSWWKKKQMSENALS